MKKNYKDYENYVNAMLEVWQDIIEQNEAEQKAEQKYKGLDFTEAELDSIAYYFKAFEMAEIKSAFGEPRYTVSDNGLYWLEMAEYYVPCECIRILIEDTRKGMALIYNWRNTNALVGKVREICKAAKERQAEPKTVSKENLPRHLRAKFEE